MTIRLLGAMALLVALASPSTASDKTLTKRIAAATVVLDELRATPDQDIPKELWDRAACVAVIPSLKKAAFVFGGEYGKGLISCRTAGAWGSPSFVLLGERQLGVPDRRRDR